MKGLCPDCGRRFTIPLQDVAWLAEALRRNPALKLICSACGWIETKRLEGQAHEHR